jgi:signal transduction histidine kinase
LALIRLFAETLELGRVTSKSKEQEYHRIIHNESRRLTQLINNILDFSKIEAGKRQYQIISGDIASVVQEALNAYEHQISSAGFDVKTYIAPALPPAPVDADALAQAILNLLNNAIKYSGEARHVEVRVEQRGGHIAIAVTDHGIGIPKSEHERIFEKFYRVSTGLVHTTKGSGLGLALVKHIVDAHSGKVLVDSALGKGSRFTILLPADSAPVESAGTQHSACLPATRNETGIGGYAVAESPNR